MHNLSNGQVKRFSHGTGRGGDWSLNVKVQPYAALDVFPNRAPPEGNPAEEAAGQRAAAHRPISLLFYVFDEMSVRVGTVVVNTALMMVVNTRSMWTDP